VGRAVAAEHDQAGCDGGRQRPRDEVTLAGQELRDRGPVLRPTVRVLPEAGRDRQIPGIVDVRTEQARPPLQQLEQADPAHRFGRLFHAGAIPTQSSGNADDHDRISWTGHARRMPRVASSGGSKMDGRRDSSIAAAW
jgi:hypothetical protein